MSGKTNQDPKKTNQDPKKTNQDPKKDQPSSNEKTKSPTVLNLLT